MPFLSYLKPHTRSFRHDTEPRRMSRESWEKVGLAHVYIHRGGKVTTHVHDTSFPIEHMRICHCQQHTTAITTNRHACAHDVYERIQPQSFMHGGARMVSHTHTHRFQIPFLQITPVYRDIPHHHACRPNEKHHPPTKC